MELGRVRAVLFDLDGTLLDTVKDIGTGANLALCRYGCPEHPLEAYRAFVGHGIRQLFRQAVPEGTDEETYQRVLDFYLRYYPEHCTDHTEIFPGIPELLRRLGAAGCRMAVVTNKTEATAVRVVRHFFPETDFAFIWGRNDARPLKPDPAAGKLACETLGLAPEEIVFFGDGDTDMAFAVNCGFAPVACSWGYRSPDQLRAAGAAAVVDTPEQLWTMLQA